MRLINCSNCFSLQCSDDGSVHPDRAVHKAGRHLRGLTKAIFQRHTTTATSPSWKCTKVNDTKTYGYADDCGDAVDAAGASNKHSPQRQYPIERKHKVKKRDLVKQLLIVDAGNFLFHFVLNSILFLCLFIEFVSICFTQTKKNEAFSCKAIEWCVFYRCGFYGRIQLNSNSIQCMFQWKEEEERNPDRFHFLVEWIYWNSRFVRLRQTSMRVRFFSTSLQNHSYCCRRIIMENIHEYRKFRAFVVQQCRCYYHYFRCLISGDVCVVRTRNIDTKQWRHGEIEA